MTSLRPLLLGGLFAGLSFACSGDNRSDDGPQHSVDVTDVVFVNDIQDEALVRMLEAKMVDDPSEYLVFDKPSAGAVIDRGLPLVFAWHRVETAFRQPQSDRGDATWRRIAGELKSFFSPIGVAHAHGVPFNGTGYYLVFSTANQKHLLRVFTPLMTYTPDAESWNKLVAGQGSIKATVSSATFENSLIVADGGPFVGGSVDFTIQ